MTCRVSALRRAMLWKRGSQRASVTTRRSPNGPAEVVKKYREKTGHGFSKNHSSRKSRRASDE